MKDYPWFKEFASDWIGNPAIRRLSPAARGVLHDLKCLMHNARPYGHALINGDKVSNDDLSRILSTPAAVFSDCVEELIKAGILKMNRANVLTYPQMIAQRATAEKGSKAVNKRWNNQEEARSDRDNHEINARNEAISENAQAVERKGKSPGPNRVPNRSPNTYSQSQSHISHNIDRTSGLRAKPHAGDEPVFPATGSIAFEEPWASAARSMGRNIDLDLLANAFRKWLGEKGIAFDATGNLKRWIKFVQNHRI